MASGCAKTAHMSSLAGAGVALRSWSTIILRPRSRAGPRSTSCETTPATMTGFSFELDAVDGEARAGTFHTPHGPVETPAFMPVGTRGTVKGVLPRDLHEVGARMLLANTYHLHLRPGEETVRALGGLHSFMGWDGPILTDSGGYQVFSLSDACTVDDDGVTFQSIVDGSAVRFTPERVVEIQAALGADVQMAFDHCAPDPLDRAVVAAAADRTHRWLERGVKRHEELGGVERGKRSSASSKAAPSKICARPRSTRSAHTTSSATPSEVSASVKSGTPCASR